MSKTPCIDMETTIMGICTWNYSLYKKYVDLKNGRI